MNYPNVFDPREPLRYCEECGALASPDFPRESELHDSDCPNAPDPEPECYCAELCGCGVNPICRCEKCEVCRG